MSGQGLPRPAERAQRVSHQDQCQPDTGRCHCGPCWGAPRLPRTSPQLARQSPSPERDLGTGWRPSWMSPGGQSGRTGQNASSRTSLLASQMQSWFSVIDVGSLTRWRKHHENVCDVITTSQARTAPGPRAPGLAGASSWHARGLRILDPRLLICGGATWIPALGIAKPNGSVSKERVCQLARMPARAPRAPRLLHPSR